MRCWCWCDIAAGPMRTVQSLQFTPMTALRSEWHIGSTLWGSVSQFTRQQNVKASERQLCRFYLEETSAWHVTFRHCFHWLLAFTRPKAGPEVGPRKLTQAFDTLPHRRLRATPLGQRAIGPCWSRTTGQRACVCENSDRRPLRRPACVARRDFLEIGHFAPFSQFLHIKGRNFPDVFICSRLPITHMNHEKFHGNRSARFEKSGRQTHRRTDAATLYI